MSSQLEQHCGNCGLPLQPGSTTCPRCGAPVSPLPTAMPQAPSGPPSEFVPGPVYDLDEAPTLIQTMPPSGWSTVSQPPGTPSGAIPAQPPFPGAPDAQMLVGVSGQAPTPTPEGAAATQAPGAAPVWQQAAPPMGAAPFPDAPAQQVWSSGMLPGQDAVPGQPFVPGAVPTGAFAPGYAVPPGGYLIQPPPPARPPLPFWFTAGAAVLVALGLFLIWYTNNEWADGARLAGIAAFVVAALVLGVFLFRFMQGYRATRTIGLAVAAVLVLILLGSAGIGLQSTFHQLQGNSLEGKQQFEAAINEFQLASNTAGIARTYNDWGEQELKQQSYKVPDDVTTPATEGAIAKFDYVLSRFAQTTDTGVLEQVRRAKEGAAQVYLAWGDQYLAKPDPQGAIDRFNLALQDAKDFGATAAFPKIHKEAAKAYFSLATQLVGSGDCTDAVTAFDSLVKDFNDTQEAQMAQVELKKPQDITGQVLMRAGTPVPNVKIFLSSHWQFSSSGYSASNDSSATSGADGSFAFKGITPGDTKYLISFLDASGNEVTAVSRASGQPVYVVQVKPLCAPDPVLVIYDL